MADLQIHGTKTDEGWSFDVTVKERGSQTEHTVLVARAAYESLTGGNAPAEDLVRASFEFLLGREPKESILRSFDLLVIPRYFKDYEQQMRARFGT